MCATAAPQASRRSRRGRQDGEELQLRALEARVPRSDQLLGFDYGRLERQLGAFLGPRPSRQDLRHLTFSFANVMAQLAGEEPLSLEYLIRCAPMALPFGLRNATEPIGHLVAQHTPQYPMNNEFMGITKCHGIFPQPPRGRVKVALRL